VSDCLFPKPFAILACESDFKALGLSLSSSGVIIRRCTGYYLKVNALKLFKHAIMDTYGDHGDVKPGGTGLYIPNSCKRGWKFSIGYHHPIHF